MRAVAGVVQRHQDAPLCHGAPVQTGTLIETLWHTVRRDAQSGKDEIDTLVSGGDETSPSLACAADPSEGDIGEVNAEADHLLVGELVKDAPPEPGRFAGVGFTRDRPVRAGCLDWSAQHVHEGDEPAAAGGQRTGYVLGCPVRGVPVVVPFGAEGWVPPGTVERLHFFVTSRFYRADWGLVRLELEEAVAPYRTGRAPSCLT